MRLPVKVFKRVKPEDVERYERAGWTITNGRGNGYSEGHGITVLMVIAEDQLSAHGFGCPCDVCRALTQTRTGPPPGGDDYAALTNILTEAIAQAAEGKGRERHASEGERFEDQQIVQIPIWLGSNQGDIFQAVKKAIESTRLPKDQARRELLGAINYLAAAVIVLDKIGK